MNYREEETREQIFHLYPIETPSYQSGSNDFLTSLVRLLGPATENREEK